MKISKKISVVFAAFSVAAASLITVTPAQAAPKNLARAVASADWLEQNIDNPKVRIFEVSTEVGLYEKGHIKNAVKINWYTDLVDTVNRDLVSSKNFNKLLQTAGIDSDTTVVFYGDKNNWFAAWGAWVFNRYGVQDVRLLDGGRVKWEKDGRALTTAVPTFGKGNFTVKKIDRSVRATLIADVLPAAKAAVKGKANVKLVDIRSADEYNGKVFAAPGFQELAIRAGHIPGAINVPWGSNVNSDGTFKSVADLKKLYAEKGIDGKQNIITYCRIGERSSLTWFVLSEILGYNVKNYDGSWTEYGNSVGVPIVNNAGTIWGAA
jgi:thiosulfate/3-mercaptopyruvate sulfurtransferase